MSQAIEILVWKRTGAMFAASQGASVWVYEPETTAVLSLEDAAGNVVSQPLLTNIMGVATTDGGLETDANRVYLTSGAQTADVRVYLAADAVDQTFKARSLGTGTTVVTLTATPGSVPIGARTKADLVQHIAEYTGSPSLGRGPRLAEIALREAVDEVNMQTWPQMLSVIDLALATGIASRSLPTGINVHIASVLLDSLGAKKQSDLSYRPLEDFVRMGLTPPPATGLPTLLTFDAFSALMLFDRTPTSEENGRIVRSLVYRLVTIPVLDGDTLGVSLDLEAYIIADAIWRVQELARVPSESRKATAATLKARVKSKPASLDLASLGF